MDCLSIQSTGDNAFTKIVNDTMAAGIPVFTVGVQSNGNELTNFTQISLKEGAQAANIVLDWMKKTGNDIKVFAVSGGNVTQNWAQGRMKGFVDTIKAAIPDATFANDETNGLNTTYDPAATYDAYKAFLQGHPDVQFIENVDIGAEHADRAIKDSDLTGKVHTIGWNVSLGQLDAVKEGTQVAALDQQWGEQAGFGALACADFLKNGIIRPNTQVLLPVTAETSTRPARTSSSSTAAANPFVQSTGPGSEGTPRSSGPFRYPASDSEEPTRDGRRSERHAPLTRRRRTICGAALVRPRAGRRGPGRRPGHRHHHRGGHLHGRRPTQHVPDLHQRPGVIRYMSTIAIVALGLTLVIVVGEIDLSFGYMYGLGATLISVAWIVWGWPIYLAILLAFAAAISIGAINAFLVTVVKIPSFIVTLGTGQLIFGMTLLVSGTETLNPSYPPAGKLVPQNEIDAFFGLANTALPFKFPMQGVWMIVVAIIVGFLLSRTLFGFRLKAIGGNPAAAELARLPIRKYKFAAFIACAVLATLAATLDFSFIGSTQPNLGQSLLFPVFAAVIIGGASLSGGRGSAIGTLSGAALLAIIANGLALLSVGAYLTEFVSGTVTIAAVVLDRFTLGRRK